MDRALLPFRVIAAAWSGGVMLGREHCDPKAYEQLLITVAKTGNLPEKIASPKLIAMIARGFECSALTNGHGDGIERDELYSMLFKAKYVPALPFELTFPEVFYPNGVPFGSHVTC
jgi:hypothetical protein